MKNTIIKNLKEQYGQDARITLTLVGTVRYPDYGVRCPEYLATVEYKLDGMNFLDDVIVDNFQSRMGLSGSTPDWDEIFDFEEDPLQF